MNLKRFTERRPLLITVAAAACLVLVLLYFREALMQGGGRVWELLADREKTARFVAAFGPGAPVVFMLLQILQVVLAPVPGEATGFIGGYLFGAVGGFIYSSIALTIGSWINYAIGRFFGRRYIRKLIPKEHLARFDRLAGNKGIMLIFILFLFPGFPKDYLCLFLGLTAIPFKVFILMATIGRMPGTFILSLQGAMLFEKNYLVLAAAALVSVTAAYTGYRYRDRLQHWLEKKNKTDGRV
ncbi:MAG: TVP38/TMEM64 family protein [Deltaproteobacteria bacterium]|nr:TVP38/TMEM64 family protein [Deltaproteobacteria bacterium]